MWVVSNFQVFGFFFIAYFDGCFKERNSRSRYVENTTYIVSKVMFKTFKRNIWVAANKTLTLRFYSTKV